MKKTKNSHFYIVQKSPGAFLIETKILFSGKADSWFDSAR